MSWEREMDEAIAAQAPPNALEQLDTALPPEGSAATQYIKGSITFSPDQSKPCHCPTCVVLELDVTRLRLGNAAILRENKRLQRELETANATIRALETKINLEGK